jgi:deoxyadenosine/deoxycytidine kinase
MPSVTLFGPIASGKTSLLAKLADSAARRQHGYPPELELKISPVNGADYADLEAAFEDHWAATSLDDIYE